MAGELLRALNLFDHKNDAKLGSRLQRTIKPSSSIFGTSRLSTWSIDELGFKFT